MSRPLFLTFLVLGAVTLANSGRLCAHPGRAARGMERLSFRVRVYNNEGVPEGSLTAAQKTADAVLEKAGLQAIWQDCTVGNPSRDSSGCDMHPTYVDLVLYLVARLEAHAPYVNRSALGYSIIPDDGEPATTAYVCFHRVRSLRSMFSMEELLGLSIAHEIVHLLLGTNLHSHSGLMKARWPKKDLEAKHWEEFALTSDEARRLHAAVLVRTTSEERAIAMHISTK